MSVKSVEWSDYHGESCEPPKRQSSDTSEIEEKINIETLEELKVAFQKTTNGGLNLDEFKSLIRHKLHVPKSKSAQIDSLFQKINWSSEDAITWDEFCTYMQLEYAEKEDSYMRAKQVCLVVPARTEPNPHREQILRISDTSEGLFIACSKDGIVSLWSANLDLKRTRSVVTTESAVSSSQRQKWITDFAIMKQYNKFIVGTGDREIAFYELSSFEPYCQISGLETVPLRMDYAPHGRDDCLILYGDSQGCVNILYIGNTGECLRTWKKSPRRDGIASVSIEVVANTTSCKFYRWKVHGDWVQELKYFSSIGQVMTCSNHSNTALVVGSTTGSTDVSQQLKDLDENGTPVSVNPTTKPSKFSYNYLQLRTRLDTDQNVFKVHKGVKTFDFSKLKNVIITGGMDRILRVWNPYVTQKPTATLRGHNAPINYLRIVEEEGRVYSISQDKNVRVWDIQDHNCLVNISSKGHKIRGDLQLCYYSPITKGLALATDQMSILCQRMKQSLCSGDKPVTHREPVHCARFNESFRQVITCSEGSVVKVWDFETGAFIFEYGDAHDGSPITCMTFDVTGRRLLTGGRDGSVKMWNYNNGHCLRTLKKVDKNSEICDVTYLELNKNRYILAVGWDRRINMYPDSLDNSVHHVQPLLPLWPDDELNGHKDDIMSVAHIPGILATSSYDGQIIVWNLVSGHVFAKLVAPPDEKNTELENSCVKKILFLNTRKDRDMAALVASGPSNMIHFWCVQNAELYARFEATDHQSAMITCLATDTADKRLFTADSTGMLTVWNISDYCLNEPTDKAPLITAKFQAHDDSISGLEIIEEYKILLTCSIDCTVKLWTMDGEFVSTFGQAQHWDVFDPKTFQHHLEKEEDEDDYEEETVQDEENNEESQSDNLSLSSSNSSISSRNSNVNKFDNDVTVDRRLPSRSVYIDDATIAEQLRHKTFSVGTGKRLRHEKNKLNHVSVTIPKEYQFLKCYELEETPNIQPPQLDITPPTQNYDD